MAEIDWAAIRAEYIAGGASLAALAEKYGVAKSAVSRRSSREKWVEKKEKQSAKKEKQLIERLTDRDVRDKVKSIEKCGRLADKLLEKISRAIGQLDKGVYVSDDRKLEETEECEEDGVSIVRTHKTRQMKVKQYKALIDTKRLSELTKSLRDLKEVLSEVEVEDDNEGGVIEIAAAEELTAPEPTENE